MADKEFFFAPSNPPRVLQWGEDREYYYNCHGDSINYEWHLDNLHLAEGTPSPEDITPRWTFNNLWDPEAVLILFYNEKK
jgi:hypothetical protein